METKDRTQMDTFTRCNTCPRALQYVHNQALSQCLGCRAVLRGEKYIPLCSGDKGGLVLVKS